MLGAAPAYAEHTQEAQITDVQFAYTQPEVSPYSGHVRWHWTLTNTGPVDARNVVLIHRLDPALTVTAVSAPCTVAGALVNCPFDEIKPGEERHGVIEADLPFGQAVIVQIHGQVTWQQTVWPVAAPAAPAAPAVSTVSFAPAAPAAASEPASAVQS
jgi:uncharacterized repeat protein (TIGR01451 family)